MIHDQTLELGPHSKARGYFDSDHVFNAAGGKARHILAAYNEASRVAALLARFALSDPKYREKALWAEASAQTLERTLGLFSADEQDHEFTGKPWRMESGA